MRAYAAGSFHANGLMRKILKDPSLLDELCYCTSRTDGGVILHYDPVKVDDGLSSLLAYFNRKNDNLFLVRSASEMHDQFCYLRDEIRASGESVDDILIPIFGGDGACSITLTALVSAFGDDLPFVSLAGGGTMTTIKKNCGVKGEDPFENIDWLCSASSLGFVPEVYNLRLMKVDDGEHVRYGSLLGMGFPVNMLGAYYSRGMIPGSDDWMTEKRSHPIYGLAFIARGIVSAVIRGKYVKYLTNPVDVKISSNDECGEFRKYAGILCGTVPDVAFGFNVLYGSGNGSNGFHMIAAPESFDAVNLVKNLRRIRKGFPMAFNVWSGELFPECELSDRVLHDADFEFDGETPWELDGEIYKSSHLSVSEGPLVRVAKGFKDCHYR